MKPDHAGGNDIVGSTETAVAVGAANPISGAVAYHSNNSSFHRVEQYGIETVDANQSKYGLSETMKENNPCVPNTVNSESQLRFNRDGKGPSELF